MRQSTRPQVVSLCSVILFSAALIIFLTGTLPAQTDTKSEFILAPLVGRLAGIGEFYGPVIGMNNIGSSTLDIVGGKTNGRIDAAGILVGQIPLLKDTLSLSAAGVQVNKLYMDVSYTRGMEEDDPVTQVGSAQGAALVFHWDLFKPMLNFNTTLANWGYTFDSYLTHIDEETIEMPDLHLGDLESTLLINDLVFDFTDNPENPTGGLRLGINLTSLETNTEFSGTQTANYFLNVYLPIISDHTWVFRGFGSDTAVSKEAITDVEEIKSKMKVDCDQLTQADQQSECENLRDSIATYLSAHNKYGTATPLGGNKMLRSFREMRFRGAHSRMLGTEFRFNFPSSGLVDNYQAALYYETGTVVDDLNDLNDTRVDSFGAALRFAINDLTLRLESANGDEGAEWFLIVGHPW